MSKQDIKHNLRRLLNYNTLSDAQRVTVEKLLSRLKSDNDDGYALYMSKYYFLDGKYSEAKKLLHEVLETGKSDFSVYYGLYKIAVKEGEFDKAYQYISMADAVKTDPGLDLALAIGVSQVTSDLDKDPTLLEEVDYQVDIDTSAYRANSLINRLYVEAMEEFNKGNYITARNKIAKITRLPNSFDISNIPFAFYILADNMDALVMRQKEIFFQGIEANDGKVTIDGKLDSVSCQRLLNYIYMETTRDVDLAERLFTENEQLFVDGANSVVTYFVRKRIAERKFSRNMDTELFKKYRSYVRSVRGLIKEENYADAIELCGRGKEETGIADFDYYIGKALFKMQDFENAEKQLLGYLGVGSYKAVKAMHYLLTMYKREGRIAEAGEVAKQMRMLDEYFIDDTDIFKKSRKSSDKKLESDKPVVTCKSIRMDIDKEFENVGELKLEDFETYTFKQKMAIIRNLHMCNNPKLAQRLTKQVAASTTDPLLRQVINKEKEGISLYKAKGKFGKI